MELIKITNLSTMRVNYKSFIDHYITHPLAKELTSNERLLSLALSILIFPITFGLLHIRSWYITRKNSLTVISDLYKDRTERFKLVAAKVNDIVFKVLKPNESKTQLDLKEVPGIVNNHFIKKYYSQKLPREEDVTVPVLNPSTGKNEWRLWSSLTREEKIRVNNTGTREHNKLSEWVPELAVDRWFFAHGQAPFLDDDPRESHGNDHSARAAIFAGLFAYLYQKYHPDHEVSMQDLILSQIVAAGHDCGRQTEGPDVYDEKSAENTKKELIALGIRDPGILHDVEEAIANKDSDPLGDKPLIAKCVQNADCAEFARILMKTNRQEKEGFENSRNYLDIYQELKAKATVQNPGDPSEVQLKNGLTFGDFCYELDALREEMNDFIYQTHQRDFRIQAEASGNYYQFVLDTINKTEFPILYHTLQHIGIQKPPPAAEEIKMKRNIELGQAWMLYGFNRIEGQSLSKIAKILQSYSDPKAQSIYLKAKAELEVRQVAEQNYLQVSKAVPAQIDELKEAYARLPVILRTQHRADLISKLPHDALKTISKEMKNVDEAQQKIDQIVLLDLMHHELKKKIRFIEETSHFAGINRGRELDKAATETLKLYKAVASDLRDDEVQTSVALALGYASEIFLNNGRADESNRVLKIAAEEITIGESSPLFDLNKLLKDESKDAFLYMPTDCNFLRKRKLRVCQKTIGETPYYEMSLELPSSTRKALERNLESIPKDQKAKVPAKYLKKDEQGYHENKGLEIGNDLKIEVVPGVEIFLGCDRSYWTQYHFMRIRIQPDIPMQKVHEALSKIGLPMALMPSRAEDKENEIISRSLAFRFPDLVYKSLPLKLSPQEIYKNLTPAQQKIVDNDIKQSKITMVKAGHYEAVQPQIAKEAKDGGVGAVGCFIYGGNTFSQTAAVLKKILGSGFMSSSERFQNGILGLGCAPTYNYRVGSGNQVFTRLLTKNLFENKFPLSNFAIKGQIFVLMDPQVLERMPYAYAHDRGGLRNPHYEQKFFKAEMQKGLTNYKGIERIKEDRLGFSTLLEELNKRPFPLNEAMFDYNIGPKYIRKLVVWNDSDRYSLIAILQKAGIHQINGLPVEDVVAVATELNPDLLKGFPSEYHEEVKDDDLEYI